MQSSLLVKAEEIQVELESFLAFGEDNERFDAVLLELAELVKLPGVPFFYFEELERIRRDDFGMVGATKRAESETMRMPESQETDVYRMFIALGERQKLRIEACKLLLSKLLKEFPNQKNKILISGVLIDTEERTVSYKRIVRNFRDVKGVPWLIVRLCVEGEGQTDYRDFCTKWGKTKNEIDTELSRMNDKWKKGLREIVFRVKDGWICIAPNPAKR